MHNVRLLTAKSMVDLCTPIKVCANPLSNVWILCEIFKGADVGSLLQMSISLYGRQLSALIMLVPRDPLWHSSSGSSVLWDFNLFLPKFMIWLSGNMLPLLPIASLRSLGFARVCEQSTELHFDPLPVQLKNVLESVSSSCRVFIQQPLCHHYWFLSFSTIRASQWREESASERSRSFEWKESSRKPAHETTLETGDVYCTRHSNLRDVQACVGFSSFIFFSSVHFLKWLVFHIFLKVELFLFSAFLQTIFHLFFLYCSFFLLSFSFLILDHHKYLLNNEDSPAHIPINKIQSNYSYSAAA